MEYKIENLNQTRLDNVNKKFTRKEIENILFSMGFWKLPGISKRFVEHGLIVRNKDYEYAFSRNPWFKSEVDALIAEVQAYFRERQNKNKESKVSKFLTEESCIKFLKEKGYIIQKLVPEHYETL